MTQSEKIYAIAKVMGYDPGTSQPEFAIMPDYFHNLTAIREVLLTLPPNHEAFAVNLMGILECNDEGELNPYDIWKVVIADPATLCEAFGLTLNLWEAQ